MTELVQDPFVPLDIEEQLKDIGDAGLEHDCKKKYSHRCAICETGFRFFPEESFEFKSSENPKKSLSYINNEYENIHKPSKMRLKVDELFQILEEEFVKAVEVFEGTL
jgi:hypothetical protein